jgi:hypothetical protein
MTGCLVRISAETPVTDAGLVAQTRGSRVTSPRHVAHASLHVHISCTVEPGYNDIVLCDTSSIASDILWYQLIPHC